MLALGPEHGKQPGLRLQGESCPPGRELLGKQMGRKMAAAWGGACAITSSTIPTHTLAFGHPLCPGPPPSHALLCSPDREIVSLVAQVVPIYAVSHLFKGLAVSTERWYHLSRLYDPRVSADDGRF